MLLVGSGPAGQPARRPKRTAWWLACGAVIQGLAPLGSASQAQQCRRIRHATDDWLPSTS